MIAGGWSKYSNDSNVVFHLVDAGQFDPMAFKLDRHTHLPAGVAPLTFDFPPPTRREGPDDRTWPTIVRVWSGTSSRRNHDCNSSGVSIGVTSITVSGTSKPHYPHTVEQNTAFAP